MTTLPPDVHQTLTQLLDSAGEALERGEFETARESVETAAAVTENKVPPGETKARLQHGYRELEPLLADEPVVAGEYLRLLSETVENCPVG
ncbi:hypothetical protein [Salinirubrum litoreum]|uniref:DUF8101 domain-containing protein n=1 Tax=Salinirubrum litoreum TaxID=1126234 RepID=A0ABD5R7L2_9EURY|nr:hypothetical protein [Salinirubrum litoreum]